MGRSNGRRVLSVKGVSKHPPKHSSMMYGNVTLLKVGASYKNRPVLATESVNKAEFSHQINIVCVIIHLPHLVD